MTDLTDIALRMLDMPVEDIYPVLDFPRLREQLAQIYRHLSIDLLNSLLYHAQSRFRTVPELMDHVTSMERLDLFLGNGRIALRPHRIVYWRRLVQHVDPDVLITKVLARNGIRPEALVDFTSGWGFYPGIEDRFLKPVFDSGLADIHIHLNGAYPIPLLWLDLVTGRERAEVLQAFSSPTPSTGPCLSPHDIKRAGTLRRSLFQNVRRQADLTGFIDALKSRNLDPILEELWSERFLILFFWHHPPVREFVVYLQIKNRFNKEFIMMPGDNPGLTSFRRYFDAPAVKVLSPSRGRRRDQLLRSLRLATDSQALQHVELRISPQPSAREYAQLIRMVQHYQARLASSLRRRGTRQSVESATRQSDGLPHITFIVHFIRKESDHVFKAFEDSMHGFELDYAGLRISQMTRTAKQAAILHKFRHRCPDLARLITGIDVANKEINSFTHFYTLWLRLLRGYECVEDNAGIWDAPGMKFWKSLQEDGLLMPPRGLPKLGLTYHVGEEFHHPLEGLMQMESVIHGARMQPGDRIGHGLAAGWNLESFHIHHGEILMPAGTLLDLLAWLHYWLSRSDSAQRALLHDISSDIAQFSRKILGNAHDARTMHRAWKLRHSLALPDDAAGKIVHRLETDAARQKERFVLAPFPQYLVDAVDELERVKAQWWKEMIERRGIIVESNPSSNLATGGLRLPASLPGVRIAGRNGGIGIAIGTDDPGVFATNLEQEYALFFEGLLGLGATRHEATDIIRHICRNSLAAVFS